MEQYQRIDEKIQDGYGIMLGGDYPSGCDKWLEAWGDIKELFNSGEANDVSELDDRYKWRQFPSNYVQDLEAELYNAGIENEAYHHKRIVFCQELINWCKESLTANNARIGIAEAYYELGEYDAGEQVFSEWLRDDPDCGMAYAGWSDCCRYNTDGGDDEKAEKILLIGYARPGLQHKILVVERLATLYEEAGKPDKARDFKRELKQMSLVRKIGRNEPCTCGSGKKHKKCCGIK